MRNFVRDEVKPVALHPSRLEPLAKPLLTDVLTAASKLGWRALALSEACGGAGADTLTACLVIEALAPGDPLSGVRLRAARKGDEWILNGEKVFIANGNIAKLFFVRARSDSTVDARHGTTLFLVPADTPGFRHGKVFNTKMAIQRVTALNRDLHGSSGLKIDALTEKLVRDAHIWTHLAGDSVTRMKAIQHYLH